MKCPFCNQDNTRVVDSRPVEDTNSIRRRRLCDACGRRFTTYEKVESIPLTVIKKDQNREQYDRSKIQAGILRACYKRPIPIEKVEEMMDAVEGEIFNTEEKEIKKDDACCNDECKCECHNDKNEECKCHDENHKKHKHKENHELEEANKKIMELQEKLMYSQADSINYRKRKDEEVANMLKYANQDLLLDMVNMIENMDRAASVKAESEESKKIQDGIKMVSNQFKDILKKYGVVEIEALGYPFDENYMEAMMIGHDTTKPNEMVLEVLMKGYKYKDRILKHAVVKVNQIEENENEKGND